MTVSSPIHVLDNAIWHALTSDHESFAIGDHLARRYPADVSPLAGLAEQSDEAYRSLANIVSPGESVFFFLNEPLNLPQDVRKHWEVKYTLPLTQMVCEHFLPPAHINPNIQPLTDDDVPQILALIKTRHPGPFEARTISLGHYFGIWQNDQLVAMSGERLNLAEYTEVSAVCTHSDFQGKGYAKSLVATVTQGIIERGKTPILHTNFDNDSAIHVYQSLGFKHARTVHFAILSHSSTATS